MFRYVPKVGNWHMNENMMWVWFSLKYFIIFVLIFCHREQLLVVLLHVTSQTLCGRPTTHKEDSLGGRFASALFQVGPFGIFFFFTFYNQYAFSHYIVVWVSKSLHCTCYSFWILLCNETFHTYLLSYTVLPPYPLPFSVSNPTHFTHAHRSFFLHILQQFIISKPLHKLAF